MAYLDSKLPAGSRAIVTVGLWPCWDTVLHVHGIQWGDHRQVDPRSCRPAGKALNVSRALAWMGRKSTAAGLWGRDDFESMLRAMQPLKHLVKLRMTAVDGQTRRNVTLVDTAREREMHLRSPSSLASPKALRTLRTDLRRTVTSGSLCVFAGSMPGPELLEDVVKLLLDCRALKAWTVVDTSGPALRDIVDKALASLIKPNVDELGELLGRNVPDRAPALADAGRELLDRSEIVLISRGPRGAVAVTPAGAWQCRCTRRAAVLSTVGCGDYLLAGFLRGLVNRSDIRSALRIAVQVATAKAWGLTEAGSWPAVRRTIPVEVRRL